METPTTKSTYANENMKHRHPTDEIKIDKQSDGQIIQSDKFHREQTRKLIKSSSQMDQNLNYHWGATPEIMQIIKSRDNSPETHRLVRRRIEIVKPGTMRIKRDSNGHEHWTPRRPDANGRRGVVGIDLRLIDRRRKR